MRKKTTSFNEEELVAAIIEAIQEKKGQGITKIDLRHLQNSVCDYFIICQGESNTQVNALADNIERLTTVNHKTSPHHVEGKENAHWILLDYFSIIVHVFQKEYREFYKLEDLWSDGKFELIND